MAEYIDREALLDELCRDNCERTYDGTCHNCRMTDTIADFPAADVAPVMHGKWDWDTKGFPRPFCNRCGEEPWRRSNHQSDLPRYCPNCGAKMDKEE